MEFLDYYEKFLLSAYSDSNNVSIEHLNDQFDQLTNNKSVTAYERNYILNQFTKLEMLNFFTLPVLKANYERMKQNYEAYFGLRSLGGENEILLADLNFVKIHRFTQSTWHCQYLSKIENVVHCGNEGNCVLHGLNRRVMINASVEVMDLQFFSVLLC